MELYSESINDLTQIAEKIIDFAEGKNVWLFNGEMGAGKTTLIKYICEKLQVEDNVSSPTFSIVNEYRTTDNNLVYHFDFYRINDESEALDIGVEEYFDSGRLCMIEWPEKIPSLIPDKYLSINIEENQLQRKIILKHNG